MLKMAINWQSSLGTVSAFMTCTTRQKGGADSAGNMASLLVFRGSLVLTCDYYHSDSAIVMPPFEEGGAYCVNCTCRSVCRYPLTLCN